MSKLENFWKAHIKKDYPPSEVLNAAFLPILKKLDSQIHTSGWLHHPPIKPTGVLPEIKTEHPLIATYSSHSDLYVQIPERLAYPQLLVSFKAPVGEYGEDWAKRLIVAATSLAYEAVNTHSRVNVRREMEKANMKYRRILQQYTFRKTPDILRGKIGKQFGTQASLVEGFQSILYAAGILTAYKVPGYEDNPTQLLLDLAKDGVISHLSLAIPPTNTATMGNNGIVFSRPTLIRQNDNSLGIQKDVLRKLALLRSTGFKHSTTGAEKQLEKAGCPLGRKVRGEEESAVDIAARLLAETVIAQKKYFEPNK